MSPLFLGFNFKLNPTNIEDTQSLLENYILATNKTLHKVVIFPPTPFLLLGSMVVESDANLALGAQDISEFSDGNHTAEISGKMLVSSEVSYVIIGHSETRSLYKLEEDRIGKKIQTALENELIPIICVGYQSATDDVDYNALAKQLQTISQAIPKNYSKEIIIAFEPTFAIGTGKTATKEQITKAINFITQKLSELKIKILYGGSINSSNFSEFLDIPNLAGFLIGKASLNPQEFKKIISY